MSLHCTLKHHLAAFIVKMANSMIMKFVAVVAMVLTIVKEAQSFKLQRPAFRQQTVLFSGDAVDKLHLEPIARIAGEV